CPIDHADPTKRLPLQSKAGLPVDSASPRHAGYPGSRKARATNYLLHPPPTTSATTSTRFAQHLESGRSRAPALFCQAAPEPNRPEAKRADLTHLRQLALQIDIKSNR